MNKGSKWNKWDLHIHTPASIIQNYGQNDDETWEKFIKDLESLPKEFKVIGINDYLFLDGYKKVLEFQKNGRLQNIDLILPVVEFRVEKFAGVDFKNFSRINLHVIFSNELSIEEIQSQFLNGLEQSYTLDKDNSEWSRAITRESLISLGAKIKEGVPKEELSKYGSDLQEGFNNVNVKEDKIFELLKRDVFKDKYFIAIGKTEWDSLKWTDSSIATKKSIINQSNIVFTAAESPLKWKNAKDKLIQQKVNDLLLDCSDSHNFSTSKNKDRIGNSFNWIKAETTFEGLQQIIYEPDERIFVGDTPELLERVKSNKTKFIKSISITQNEGYTENKGIWFKKLEIPLNYGMVSIIGNKGNGKSALADIIGLCGNSHHYKDFSFLNKNRFLKSGLANNFIAKLSWANDETITKVLSDNVDYNAPERVRYLPQSFFDKLTNNLDNYAFKKTLEDIVFSYLPEEEKLGKNSFEDLIKYKEENINKDIELIVNEIKSINTTLIELEKQAHPSYKDKLIKELEIKKKELEEHLKNKPKEIKNPDSDETTKEQYKKVSEQLLDLNKKREKVEKDIIECEKNKVFLKQKIEKLTNIKQDIVRFENEIKDFKSSQNEKLKEYDLNIDEIIKYNINLQELDKLISKQKNEYRKILYQLFTEKEITENFTDEEHKALKEKSLIIQQSLLIDRIEKLKNQLSEPYKKYQEYLENLNKWNKIKKEIEGDKNIPKTIEWYNSKITYIESELSNIIDSKRTDRIHKSIKILKEKLKLVNVYNKLKESVDSEILAYKGILKDYDINIDVALKLNTRFSETFLSYINQNRTGSFYQKDQGKMRIEKLIENKNFQDTIELEKFLKDIIENLEIDKREEHNNTVRYIIEQINSDNLFDFYNYIFSIDYLEPSYELKLGDKHITELSPGEKGAMLIVFYLMLEKDNIPLIIDQPEENLDNESIYKILVHFIKETKKRRQVILVTHNPNLAIVGDSEQIIYVNIDKKNGNIFNFESGAIENPIINKHASKILEGTIKAFNIRRLKYVKV